MQTAHRIFFSVCAASLVPAVLYTLVSSILDAGFRGWAVIIFPLVLLTTFVHTFLLGAPFFLLLRKLDSVYWWSMAALGFTIGALPIGLLAALMSWLHNGVAGGWGELIMGSLGCGALGSVGGFTFFLAWIYSNRQQGRKSEAPSAG